MNKTLLNLSLAMLIGITALAGCGRRSMPTSPDESPTPAATATPAVTPSPSVTPTPEPTVAPVNEKLAASITSKKNGTLFGIGAYVVTVDVANDNASALNGTLNVQFTNGGKADPTHLKTLQVSLSAGEHQSYSFEDKSWGIDDCTVTVETQASQYTSGSSYNNTSNYSNYGNYSYTY